MEAVSVILKEGSLVGTRLDNSPFWCANIVYKSEGRIVYVALIDRYIEDSVAPGRTISIKYVDEYFIYLFEGVIIKTSMEYPGYAAVRTTSAEEVINGRLSPRYDVHLSASLKTVWDSGAYPATVIDISYGGTAFICNRKFDHNEEVDIDIRLSGDKTIKARGKIVRKNIRGKITEYSLQFSDMDDGSYKALSLYFSRLEEDAGAMYRHFITDIKGKSHPFTY